MAGEDWPGGDAMMNANARFNLVAEFSGRGGKVIKNTVGFNAVRNAAEWVCEECPDRVEVNGTEMNCEVDYGDVEAVEAAIWAAAVTGCEYSL